MENLFKYDKDKLTYIYYLSNDVKNRNLMDILKNNDINEFHDISEKAWDLFFDWYNEFMKYQINLGVELKYLGILNFYTDREGAKSIIDEISKTKDFIKWIEVDDIEWVDKIEEFFINYKKNNKKKK